MKERVSARIDRFGFPSEEVEFDREVIETPGNLLIVSEGDGFSTQVYCNGVELKNVISVEISKITPDGTVKAKQS